MLYKLSLKASLSEPRMYNKYVSLRTMRETNFPTATVKVEDVLRTMIGLKKRHNTKIKDNCIIRSVFNSQKKNLEHLNK
jgi:hypothetical protein